MGDLFLIKDGSELEHILEMMINRVQHVSELFELQVKVCFYPLYPGLCCRGNQGLLNVLSFELLWVQLQLLSLIPHSFGGDSVFEKAESNMSFSLFRYLSVSDAPSPFC